MPNYSQATVIGHLGRDPEQRGDFASVSVAVTKKSRDEKRTTWWKVSCYKKDADALMKLKKGDSAMFTGEPELTEYANRDGVVKQSLDLSFARVVFLGGKSEGKGWPDVSSSKSPQEDPDLSDSSKTSFDSDDNIPF